MSVWSQLIAKQPNVLFARGLQNDRAHKARTTKVYKQANDHVSTEYILCFVTMFRNKTFYFLYACILICFDVFLYF